ncbi:hypothetical protein [Lacunimicrobium album]
MSKEMFPPVEVKKGLRAAQMMGFCGFGAAAAVGGALGDIRLVIVIGFVSALFGWVRFASPSRPATAWKLVFVYVVTTAIFVFAWEMIFPPRFKMSAWSMREFFYPAYLCWIFLVLAPFPWLMLRPPVSPMELQGDSASNAD